MHCNKPSTLFILILLLILIGCSSPIRQLNNDAFVNIEGNEIALDGTWLNASSKLNEIENILGPSNRTELSEAAYSHIHIWDSLGIYIFITDKDSVAIQYSFTLHSYEGEPAWTPKSNFVKSISLEGKLINNLTIPGELPKLGFHRWLGVYQWQDDNARVTFDDWYGKLGYLNFWYKRLEYEEP